MSQIYAWRTGAQYEASRSDQERGMAAEIAKLKRPLAEHGVFLVVDGVTSLRGGFGNNLF